MERERRAGAQETASEPGPDADALSLQQVEAVLRRAAQIDAGRQSPGASGLASEEVTRIALEAGLSAGAVDAALRELELGKLGAEVEKADLLDERIGPNVLRVARAIDLSPDAAHAAVQRLLAEEVLEPVERSGRRTIWGPQQGMRANLLRTVRRGWAGGADLRKMELTSEVRPADSSGTRSIVAIEAKLQGRGEHLAGLLVLAGCGALGAVGLGGVGFAHWAQHLNDAAAFLAASGGVATTFGFLTGLTARSVKQRWRERLRRVRANLEKLLDGL